MIPQKHPPKIGEFYNLSVKKIVLIPNTYKPLKKIDNFKCKIRKNQKMKHKMRKLTTYLKKLMLLIQCLYISIILKISTMKKKSNRPIYIKKMYKMTEIYQLHSK